MPYSESHLCDIKCTICRKAHTGSRCFVKQFEEKQDSTFENYRRLYFDFESIIENGIHQPILCVIQYQYGRKIAPKNIMFPRKRPKILVWIHHSLKSLFMPFLYSKNLNLMLQRRLQILVWIQLIHHPLKLLQTLIDLLD